jgi:hypothetical protein
LAPQNEQIDVALNSFLESRALANPSKKLSTEGQALVADFRDVVKQAKNLLLSKNEGNLLQDFIWQTTQFDPSAVSTPDAPIDKQTAKQHGNKAAEGLRTLGTLLITNGQFRKLLNDAVLLLRDMAGDAAENAASKVKPSSDALAQIDRPAEDNTWHDAPDLSKDNLKSQLNSAYKGDAKQDVKDVANAGQNGAQSANTADGQALGGANSAQSAVADKFNNKVSDDTQQQVKETKENAKETAAEYRARVKQYLSKKVPEERRDQTIWRLKVYSRSHSRIRMIANATLENGT